MALFGAVVCCQADWDSVPSVSLLQRGLRGDALANTAIQRACGFRGAGPGCESAEEEPCIRTGVGGFLTEPKLCLPVLSTLVYPQKWGMLFICKPLLILFTSSPFLKAARWTPWELRTPLCWERERSSRCCWVLPCSVAVGWSAGQAEDARSLCWLLGTNWLLPVLSCLQTPHSASLPLVVSQAGWVPHVFLSPPSSVLLNKYLSLN